MSPVDERIRRTGGWCGAGTEARSAHGRERNRCAGERIELPNVRKKFTINDAPIVDMVHSSELRWICHATEWRLYGPCYPFGGT